MKKIGVMILAVSLVGAMSLAAFAGPQGQGYGRQGQRGAYAQITDQQRAEIQKARTDFLNATVDIRKKMAEKRVEMRTLMAQPKVDQAKFKALAFEMIDLRSQLAKARVEHLGAYAKYMGPGFGGMGFGPRGKRGSGFRSGGGPGYGPGPMMGYGPGGGRGFGGGYCWR